MGGTLYARGCYGNGFVHSRLPFLKRIKNSLVMTTEQKLGALEGLCERVYEMGKDILDPNVKDTKRKIKLMVQVAGAFMGGYDYYKKKIAKI